jgi:hypothetical protein
MTGGSARPHVSCPAFLIRKNTRSQPRRRDPHVHPTLGAQHPFPFALRHRWAHPRVPCGSQALAGKANRVGSIPDVLAAAVISSGRLGVLCLPWSCRLFALRVPESDESAHRLLREQVPAPGTQFVAERGPLMAMP